MASTIMHLAIAEFINTHFLHFEGEDKKKFLLGSIIVDSYQIAEERIEGRSSSGKKTSHFIRPGYKSEPNENLDFSQWIPDIQDFSNKYSDKLNGPFYLGYLSHLLADKNWWGELLPNITQKNIPEINSNAKTINDITNSEFLTWYRDTGIYKEFDDTDTSLPVLELGLADKIVNKFPELTDISLSGIDIPELGDEHLIEKTICALDTKLKGISESINKHRNSESFTPFSVQFNRKIGYKNILDYIESSAESFFKYVEDNNINIGIKPKSKSKDVDLEI